LKLAEKGDVMVTATKRIQVPVTHAEKQITIRKAAQAGISVGEYMKLATAAYRKSDDDQLLEWMIDQMTKSANRAILSIDETLAFVEASNNRIAAYEKNVHAKR
jgi:hypothetical protein